jgi:hypothetical protein
MKANANDAKTFIFVKKRIILVHMGGFLNLKSKRITIFYLGK